jgi:hypothetical protein
MNAEGNLKTHVLRRKRGSACVFGRTDWIKGLGRAPFSIEVFSLDSIHLYFAVATAQVIKKTLAPPFVRIVGFILKVKQLNIIAYE